MAKRKGAGGGTIVLRRIEEGGYGHHGGAWKVAYADFVTAMMAFFLLMWLLNATTEEQRRGLADYFNPMHALANGVSGTGQPFGGSTPHTAGRMASDTGAIRLERGPRPILAELEEEDDSAAPAEPFARREGPRGEEETPPPRMATPGGAELGRVLPGPEESDAARLTDAALRAELARREEAALQDAAEALRETLRDDPALSAAAGQFLVEVTPEGLRIQLLEADG
ncbi:flagellar motor protein MotB [Sabulicella rubraurantiaca]|uniref:flagellar motor protein MotB n=1 Tax=Sabulicella rubraurantiaca TaxID=2811429 RepID=UPI001A973791|nr:flagellar motor protein MotB [Sabulicella rubraurantiaca]